MYVCLPVGKALAETTAGAAGKGRHQKSVQEKEETKATSEKTGAESRPEVRLTAMKDAGLFPCDQVCSGSRFPCAYIYKTNRGLQQHQEKSDADAQHHPSLRGRRSGLRSTGALVVLVTGFQHGGRPDADSAAPAQALP